MLNLKLDMGKLSGSMLDCTFSKFPLYDRVILVMGHLGSSEVSVDPDSDEELTGRQITLPILSLLSSSVSAASPPLPHALVP